jgi:hypothetical protein
LIAVTAMAALCACGQADEAEPASSETEVAAADVPDGGPVEGSFTVTNMDGSTTSWTNNEDGTYNAVLGDGTEGSGTFTMTGRDYCYDPAGDGEGLEEICLAFSKAAEDGSWTSMRPDGSKATVKRDAVEEDGSGADAAE